MEHLLNIKQCDSLSHFYHPTWNRDPECPEGRRQATHQGLHSGRDHWLSTLILNFLRGIEIRLFYLLRNPPLGCALASLALALAKGNLLRNPPLGCALASLALALAKGNLLLSSGPMVRHYCHGLTISTHQ